MLRRFVTPTFLIVALCSLLVTSLAQAGSPSRLAALQASPEATSCAPTPDADAEALAFAFQETLKTGDISGLDQILAPDYVHHWGHGEDAVGIDAHAARVTAFAAAFEDFTYTQQIPIVADGYVTMIWEATGRQVEPLGNIGPSSDVSNFTGINVFHIECGRIVESWSEVNFLDALIQTGVITDEELATVGTPTP